MAQDNDTAIKDNNQQAIVSKGMTIEKLMDKFGAKLTQEKAKVFEQKFAAKYKELDAARAIANGIEKELEKMYVEFTENL